MSRLWVEMLEQMKDFLFSSQPPENTWRDVQKFDLDEFYITEHIRGELPAEFNELFA